MPPCYPKIQIRLHSRNAFALVSAVQQGMRLPHIDRREIDRFTEEALRVDEP